MSSLDRALRAMTPAARRRAEAKLRALSPHKRDDIRRRINAIVKHGGQP